MTCPFLREAQVKFCRTAAVRKLIPLALAGKTDEKCSSGEYRHVRGLPRASRKTSRGSARCPYLHESLMQYCGAAPVASFVPYSESLISRCGNDSFRYCELYLGMAHPAPAAEEVDGIPLPGLAALLGESHVAGRDRRRRLPRRHRRLPEPRAGKVDRISYVWQKGERRPAAVLTVNGLDLEVVFPESAAADRLQSVPARGSLAPRRRSRTRAGGCSKERRFPRRRAT